jgi:hypothetical protein
VRHTSGLPLIVAQVRDGQAVPRDDWPVAMVRCNSWNSRVRLPKASVAVGDAATAQEGMMVVEGALPDGDWLTGEVVDRFLDAVIQGARTFWMAAARA